eukprot:gene8941-890_t
MKTSSVYPGVHSDEQKLNFLKNKWISLCKNDNVQNNNSKEWWLKIQNYLTEEHRFYHNFKHIYRLYEHLEEFKNEILKKDEYIFELTIFFHDIIYNCSHGQDEDESNEIFLEFSKETKLKQEDIDRVSNFILSTKNHLSCKSNDNSLLLFLDFDLLILGSSKNEYLEYSNNIMNEFLPKLSNNQEEFKKKRIDFLKKMIKFENLFFSKIIIQKYQKLAFDNLKMEIDLLSQTVDSRE